MQTHLKSLFMVLLLVFATLPVYASTGDDDSFDFEEEAENEFSETAAIELSDDIKKFEPRTFWLKKGESKRLESNLYLTYLGSSQKPSQLFCTKEVKTCSDGTSVGRNPKLGCAFDACPDEDDESDLVFDENQGICESFELVYEHPSKGKSKGKSSVKSLQPVDSKVFSTDFIISDVVPVTVEDKAKILISKADVFVAKIEQDIGHAGDLDESDIRNIKREKEKLLEELEEGDMEEIEEHLENLKKKLDKAQKKLSKKDKSGKDDDENGEDDDKRIKDFKPFDQTVEKESVEKKIKDFCLVQGEVGYPIILYEKKDSAVLVGYNVWKDDSSFDDDAAMTDDSDKPQKKKTTKKSGLCTVDGDGEVPIGTRLNVEGISQYCDPLTKKMQNQKVDGAVAENDYECFSNEARNGLCVNSLNFLERIWKAIAGIFGF